MEARYLTNEEGERVGVDVSSYEAVERELEEKEGLLLQLLETARHLPQTDYEQFWELLREQSVAKGMTPEQVERRLDVLEDYEALLASTDDAESEEDWDDAVPLREALRQAEEEHVALRRRGEL